MPGRDLLQRGPLQSVAGPAGFTAEGQDPDRAAEDCSLADRGEEVRSGGEGSLPLGRDKPSGYPDESPDQEQHQGQSSEAKHQALHRLALHSSPVKPTGITHVRRKADSSKLIVHKAAGAESHGEIKRCQHKDDDVESPADCRCCG